MRIIAKTTTYGIMHMIVAFTAALVVSRDLHIALGISLLEPVLQISCFWVHEHLWEKYRPGAPSEHNICCAETAMIDKFLKIFRSKKH